MSAARFCLSLDGAAVWSAGGVVLAVQDRSESVEEWDLVELNWGAEGVALVVDVWRIWGQVVCAVVSLSIAGMAVAILNEGGSSIFRSWRDCWALVLDDVGRGGIQSTRPGKCRACISGEVGGWTESSTHCQWGLLACCYARRGCSRKRRGDSRKRTGNARKKRECSFIQCDNATMGRRWRAEDHSIACVLGVLRRLDGVEYEVASEDSNMLASSCSSTEGLAASVCVFGRFLWGTVWNPLLSKEYDLVQWEVSWGKVSAAVEGRVWDGRSSVKEEMSEGVGGVEIWKPCADSAETRRATVWLRSDATVEAVWLACDAAVSCSARSLLRSVLVNPETVTSKECCFADTEWSNSSSWAVHSSVSRVESDVASDWDADVREIQGADFVFWEKSSLELVLGWPALNEIVLGKLLGGGSPAGKWTLGWLELAGVSDVVCAKVFLKRESRALTSRLSAVVVVPPRGTCFKE